MSLPDSWVKELHKRLLLRYGAAWVNMWVGLDMQELRDDWAEVLGHCAPERIAYALANLPLDRPPNAQQFKALCMQMPAPVVRALQEPRGDPEKAAAAMVEIKEIVAHRPSLNWAVRLKEREQAGEYLNLVQKEFWRIALKDGVQECP